jgi:hypothetical protein
MCVRDSKDYVNYREFKDFKDRIQDQFDKITELVYKEHYQLEEELDEFRKEIKRHEIEQLEFQLEQQEKLIDSDSFEDEENKRHRRTLTVAIIAAIMGPLVGAVIGASITYFFQ